MGQNDSMTDKDKHYISVSQIGQFLCGQTEQVKRSVARTTIKINLKEGKRSAWLITISNAGAPSVILTQYILI